MLLKKGNKKKESKKKKKNIIDALFEEVDDKKENEIKKSKPRFTRIEMAFITFIAVMFGLVIGCMVTIYTPLIFGFRLDDEVMEFLSSYDSVVNEYYGEVNKKELVDSAISGMLSSLDDDYSYYMDG